MVSIVVVEIRADMISELHGNCYIETCRVCSKEYLRDFDVCDRRGRECKLKKKNEKSGISHCTGRICTEKGCGGCLEDSIIHFHETLPTGALQLASKHCSEADLVICLGSSMTVQPACGLPKKAIKNGGKMVIVNLQKTQYDDLCALRLFGKTDEVMEKVMKLVKGGLEIPAFHLKKNVVIGNTNKKLGEGQYQWKLFVEGECGTRVDFIRKVEVGLHDTFTPKDMVLEEAPFEVSRTGWGTFDVKLKLHYGMPGMPVQVHECKYPLSFAEDGASETVTLTLS